MPNSASECFEYNKHNLFDCGVHECIHSLYADFDLVLRYQANKGNYTKNESYNDTGNLSNMGSQQVHNSPHSVISDQSRHNLKIITSPIWV